MLVISIDLWGTLIKSSPHFVNAKVELTKKYFPNLETDFILNCYSETKKQLNDLIEQTGFQPNTELMFTLLFSKLSGTYIKREFLYEFAYAYQKLAMEISPQLYSEETLHYLTKLSKLGNLYLSSNTMLISGRTLGVILNKLDIAKKFSQYYFSDQVGNSKPHKAMYGYSNWHIGDNVRTDDVGAFCAGSKSIIINSNDKTIKDAYNIIAQVRSIR